MKNQIFQLAQQKSIDFVIVRIPIRKQLYFFLNINSIEKKYIIIFSH